MVHTAFAHAIEGLVILKQMNNHLAVTRAQGCSNTINNIFKDEFGSDVNALRNVTVLRGERGSTVQLDDTILFAADTSTIVRTDSSTPSNESPDQKMPAIERKPEETSTTTTSTSNETGQEVTDPGTTDPQAYVIQSLL